MGAGMLAGEQGLAVDGVAEALVEEKPFCVSPVHQPCDKSTGPRPREPGPGRAGSQEPGAGHSAYLRTPANGGRPHPLVRSQPWNPTAVEEKLK